MKNTRRAAAAWMTMSLAVSTVLGNTAWGDVLQETGKNRCVHVHTAECYGDADETATMSQTGELEPTECTHVCSVESGCILDTEDLENNDADARKVGTPSNADQKDTEDGGVVSVSTPSNAEDTTINPGGTVTPAVQTKILSWSWFDPEENLLDGRLELTGITEEAQPSFTEVTEYLPQAIIAQVGEGEDWEEKNLQITNWTCTEYVQDEEGRWPLEGTYEFKAELPEGYELADGVDALVVEVSVAGDQAAVTADTTVLYIAEANKAEIKNLYWNGNNFSGPPTLYSCWNREMKVEHVSGDNFKLTLTGATLGNIHIASGNWTIILKGENKLDGKGQSSTGIALKVGGGSAEIIGENDSASLSLEADPSKNGSSGIEVDSSLTITSGKITAIANAGSKNNSQTGAILVGSNGTLNIQGGEITAVGNGKKAFRINRDSSKVYVSGGKLNTTGTGANVFENQGTLVISGGTVTAKSESNGIGFFSENTGTTTISNGGKLDISRVHLKEGSITVEKWGELTSGSTVIENGSLINKGEFVSNGAFEMNGSGKFTNEGKISGSGSVPKELRQPPDPIEHEKEVHVLYTGSVIDVGSSAKVKQPTYAGPLHYSLVSYEGSGVKGEGTITEDGQLTVTKAGNFTIKVYTKETEIYKSGDDPENSNIAYIALTVEQSEDSENWKLTVNAVKKMYDGKEVAPATITDSNIPENVNASYQYQLATEKNATLLEDNWKSSLTIKDVVDSKKYVFVRVVTDNYAPRVFVSADTTEIGKRTFSSSVAVTIEPDVLIYNGEPQMPKIKVLENWDGALKNKLKENVDYTISFWEKKISEGTGLKIKDSEIKDAGTYEVHLLGTGNYDNSTNSATFTIQKSTLFLMINGNVKKVYDGTVGVTDAQNLAIQLATTKEGINPFDKIYVDHVEWEYNYADAGKRVLTAHDIKIAGPNVENYQLESTSVSYDGWIEKRDFASMTVSAAPLTYNGTEQQPKINASVETGLENVSPDAIFTYSKDGVNYQNEIPGFTEAGTYLVYVKASMANFNDEVRTVAVTVTPKESSSGGNSGNDSGNNSGSNSGNNSGTSTSGGSSSNNGNSGSGNSGNGSSSSDRDRSDRDDSNASVVKVSPGQSGKVTKDSQKGYRNEEQGVITGANNQAVNDGYSHWMKDAKGWWLRYSDGTWPMGRAGAYHWEKINGRWWAFGSDGYISSGWIYDTIYQGWFYMDENQGMLTGWQFINGKWYYLNPNSDGTAGIMYTKRRTPDGWYVKEDGSWDEGAGR